MLCAMFICQDDYPSKTITEKLLYKYNVQNSSIEEDGYLKYINTYM